MQDLLYSYLLGPPDKLRKSWNKFKPKNKQGLNRQGVYSAD